jgi:hypothetical protein
VSATVSRRRVRRRLLITAVVAIELIGIAALAFALTRTSHDQPTAKVSATVAPAAVAHPQAPETLIGDPTAPPTTAAAATSRRPRTPAPQRPPASFTPLHLTAALAAARSEVAAGHRIGFAVVTADGRTLAQLNSSMPTYSGSITKAMLLIAYLRQHADAPLSQATRDELGQMIEISDNDAADWVYDHLDSPQDALIALAQDAGMSGLQIDTTDPVYVLGQSLITAGDFAHLFSRIDQLLPASQRGFGLYLLSHVTERVGLLDAGLPGAVYSKEGWKPEPAGLLGSPYIVNQAAQFTDDGTTYGVAVTVGDVSDQTEGEAVVERIVSALP